MNDDDIGLLRELDARKTAQLAAAHECVTAADALIDGLYRTRGANPPALIAAYEVARAAYNHEMFRHEPVTDIVRGVADNLDGERTV